MERLNRHKAISPMRLRIRNRDHPYNSRPTATVRTSNENIISSVPVSSFSPVVGSESGVVSAAPQIQCPISIAKKKAIIAKIELYESWITYLKSKYEELVHSILEFRGIKLAKAVTCKDGELKYFKRLAEISDANQLERLQHIYKNAKGLQNKLANSYTEIRVLPLDGILEGMENFPLITKSISTMWNPSLELGTVPVETCRPKNSHVEDMELEEECDWPSQTTLNINIRTVDAINQQEPSGLRIEFPRGRRTVSVPGSPANGWGPAADPLELELESPPHPPSVLEVRQILVQFQSNSTTAEDQDDDCTLIEGPMDTMTMTFHGSSETSMDLAPLATGQSDSSSPSDNPDSDEEDDSTDKNQGSSNGMDFTMQMERLGASRVILPDGLTKIAVYQKSALEGAFRNRDAIVQSGPGTGKTTIAVIRLLFEINVQNPQMEAIALVPNEEAADAFEQLVADFSGKMGQFSTTPLCVKASELAEKEAQFKSLQFSLTGKHSNSVPPLAHIIIGTPKEILELIDAPKDKLSITSSFVKMLVIDGLDEMLKLNFRSELDQIYLRGIHGSAQIMVLATELTPPQMRIAMELTRTRQEMQRIVVTDKFPEGAPDPETGNDSNPNQVVPQLPPPFPPDLIQNYVRLAPGECRLEGLANIIFPVRSMPIMIFCDGKGTEILSKLRSRRIFCQHLDPKYPNLSPPSQIYVVDQAIPDQYIWTRKVRVLINFDCPPSTKEYRKRLGCLSLECDQEPKTQQPMAWTMIKEGRNELALIRKIALGLECKIENAACLRNP